MRIPKRMITLIGAAILIGAVAGRAASARFSRHTEVADEPSVTDGYTRLIWQGCPAGLSGSDCETGALRQMTWAEALSYCEALPWADTADWRLPNKNELISITDTRRTSPAVDTNAFPGTPSDRSFWTGTSFAGQSAASYAWIVYSGAGHASTDIKNNLNYVRCVRGGT